MLFALVVAFFSLTRTQVGRDQLGNQIEREFAQRFSGTLDIGNLTGNLLNTLYAVDVAVKDLNGDTVIQIDSMVIQPKWTYLLRKRFSLHKLILIRPDISLIFGENGQTNIQDILTKAPADSSSFGLAWKLQSISLEIQDGSIHSSNVGTPKKWVENGTLFDFSNTTIENLDFEADLDFGDNNRQIDILAVSGLLSDHNLALKSGETQLIVKNDRLSINQLGLQIGVSDVSVSGYFDLPSPDRSSVDMPFLLEIDSESLSFSELHALFPKLPLSGTAALSTYIQGPLSDLTLSWLRVTNNNSTIELAGTAFGYPNRVELDVSLTNSTIGRPALEELFPSVRWNKFLNAGDLQLSAYLEGTLTLNENTIQYFAGRSTLDLRSAAGLISASASLDGRTDSLKHSVSLLTEQLDLSKWTLQNKHASTIAGSAKIEGYSSGLESFYSTINGSLTDFSWNKATFERIDFDLDADREHLGGDVSILNQNGKAVVKGDLILSEEPWIELSAGFTDWNMGFLIEDSKAVTSLNGRLEASSSLAWNSDFGGKLSVIFDSSWVKMDEITTLSPPFSAQVNVYSPTEANGQIFELTSDFARVAVKSPASLPTLIDLGSAWISGFQQIVRRETDKKLYPDRAVENAFPDSPLTDLLRWEKARFQFKKEGFTSTLPVEITIDVLDAERISDLAPTVSDFAGATSFKSVWRVSPDSLAFSSDVEAFDLSIKNLALHGFSAHSNLTASRDGSVPNLTGWSVDVATDSLQQGEYRIGSTTFSTKSNRGVGTVSVSSGGTKGIDSLDIQIDLSRFDTFNRATITQFLVRTKAGVWKNTKPSDIALYGDATQISDLNVVFHDPNGPTDQSVMVSGAFSSNPSDVLSVDVKEISLRDVSEFASINPLIGGRLNTQLAISGGYAAPLVTGTVDIESFSLDHRILGDINASSTLIAGSSDIGLDLKLTPLPADRSSVIYGTSIEGERIASDLIVKGSFRIPSKADGDRGNLDLFVDVDRAGLFFLNYIFTDAIDQVSGYLAGDGTIKGSLSTPLFDFNLGVLDGKFSVPITQSQYEIDGGVRVDQEAIHLSGVQIRDTQGGKADIDGRILFNDYRFFSLDIAGNLDELQIMNVIDSESLPFYGKLYASGDLDLKGPLYDAMLYSINAVTRANSELYIPISPDLSETDESFIVFEDSLGVIPDFNKLSKRPSILAGRPSAERKFLDGLNLDLSITAPEGSTIHLVIDPLLGDVINAKSTGTVQLIRGDDSFQTFGQLSVDSGDYLFTAGELFYRKFTINEGGTITWNGDPVNASLSIPASYRTRASRSGLPGSDGQNTGLIPLIVNLQISGTVTSPQVDLSLSIDRANQNVLGDYQALEAQLNQADRATEYATSVLLTNSFQLTTENITTDSGSQLAFNSVSQLVSAQLNRFLNEALPNVDFSFGLLGENTADLDVTYGVALRLLDERLIIRGEGVYQGARAADNIRTNEGLQGEFVVEIRISPRVSVEVFFRREGDILETSGLTNTTGVGVSYQTDFDSWNSFFKRLSNSSDQQ